jgi:hypothetical protein
MDKWTDIYDEANFAKGFKNIDILNTEYIYALMMVPAHT